jgi:hypothetical protein
MRGALHRPQRDLEDCLKTFGGGGCNRARSGSGKGAANELDRLTHQIGEARGETRMFKQSNGCSQRCQIFWRHGRARPRSSPAQSLPSNTKIRTIMSMRPSPPPP